ELVSLDLDCDRDTLLVTAHPQGPTCHLQRESCFASAPGAALAELSALVEQRHADMPAGSYTTSLFEKGTRRIAQKVGEEGVETALAAVVQDDDALLGEAADLVFHLLVLLRARGRGLAEVEARLATRRRGEGQRRGDAAGGHRTYAALIEVRTQSRPLALAAYRALSAISSASSMSSAASGATVCTPMLAEIRTCRSCVSQRSSTSERRSSSATATAARRSWLGSTTTNSSLPNRASSASCGRSVRPIRCAAQRRQASPTRWP